MKTGLHVGAYVIEAPLNAGAMGALHRARHTTTGDVVALKTVHHAMRAHLHGLRREIRALQAIEHPNVVRIIDADTDAWPPWYAMELIEGLSLNQHWSVAPVQTRWSQYLRCFADVCDGLEAVHGLGMVHRDLKPGNVVIRGAGPAAGEAVVVDFGLATISGGGLGREQLFKRSEVVGTPQYISPEQVSQQPVDPRADLYSLGCMLYELLVGRPPFLAEVPFVGMLKHVNEAPVIPAEVIARAPAPLVELVYALLEKDPGDRPGYAGDVRRVLAELGDVPARAQKPATRTYLHRPRFVGREAFDPAFDRIGEAFSSGRGGVALVRGPGGAGKSRLAIELIRRVQTFADEHVEVLLAQSPQSTTTPPMGSLRAWFEEVVDLCVDRGDRFSAEMLGADAALLSRHLPVLRGAPAVSEPTAAQLAPETVENATLDAVTTILERLARHKPLVVALDDVEWADPLTARWVERVAQQKPWSRVPLLLVLVGRDGAEAFGAFSAATDATVLDVGPLSDASLAQMIESMTGVAQVPPEFFAAIQAEARGLPSRAAQWLSAAVGRGALVRVGGDWRFQGVPIADSNIRHTMAIDASFDALLAQRLRTLDSAAGALVDLLAVLGPRVRPEVLAYLGPDEVATLDRLITEGLLVAGPRGEVEFASADLLAIARGRLDGRGIAPLHVRAAAILEAVGAPILEIARHLSESGWRDEARARLFAAADVAFDAGVWAEAEQLYTVASELGFRRADHEVVGHARLAILRFRHGRNDDAGEALRAAEAALVRASDPVSRGEIGRARGLLLRPTDPAAAAAALEEACDAFAEADSWQDERNARIELGNAHCRAGDFARGRAEFMRVHDAARQREDAEGVAVALASVGTTWISDRRYEVATDFLSRAADQFRALDLPMRLADALYNLGVCEVDCGHTDAGIAAFTEVCTLRAAAGDQRGAAQGRSALGHALLVADRPVDALVELEAAIGALARTTDRYLLAAAYGYAGEAAAQLRQFSAAMDHFVAALNIHRTLPFSTLQPYVHVEIAKLHRRLGLYEDAQVHLNKARALDPANDALLGVVMAIEAAYLSLAWGDTPDVDIAAMRDALGPMQLPPASPVVRALGRLEAALAADSSARQHGELRTDVPPAFRS